MHVAASVRVCDISEYNPQLRKLGWIKKMKDWIRGWHERKTFSYRNVKLCLHNKVHSVFSSGASSQWINNGHVCVTESVKCFGPTLLCLNHVLWSQSVWRCCLQSVLSVWFVKTEAGDLQPGNVGFNNHRSQIWFKLLRRCTPLQTHSPPVRGCYVLS